jgi:hypothetical protein
MALNLDTVDKIHTRLLVRYAGKWLNLYAGIDPSMVKSDWAEELGGMRGGRIEHAFQNLPPDNPPNAAQFRALCLLWRAPAPKALPAPKPDPEQARNGLERLNAALAGIGKAQASRGRLQWAYDLQERDKQGDDLTHRQRADYKHALARYAPIQHSDMTPVPIEALPPAMRAEAERKS